MRVPVELKNAYRLVNHGPVVLVSASSGGRDNVMAAAWCMALDFSPPKLAIVLAADSHTRSLVDESGELVVQVPPRRMLEIIDGVGTCSGRDEDKWEKFGLERAKAGKVKAPLVEGCTAWLECKVIPEPAIAEKYDLFVVEVVAAWADDEAFEKGRWREDLPEPMRAVHHIAGGAYVVDGKQVRASKR
jgi:flavin reductase (DIM6/NTAB) family NADH-FMN oxidoreductase RutF